MNQALFEHRRRQHEAVCRGLTPPGAAPPLSGSSTPLADKDYFRGYRGHLPHPFSPSTGSEGRCDLCGFGPVNRMHDKPYQRLTEAELEAEAAQRRAEKEVLFPFRYGTSEPFAVRDFAQNTDLSYGARQSRLDNIPTKEPNMTINFGGDYLLKWLFSQNEVWITATGESKRVDEMDLDHCLNTLLMMERVADDLPFESDALQEKALYKALYARVKNALTGLDVGPTETAPEFEDGPSAWQTFPLLIRRLLEINLPVAGRLSRRVEIEYVDRDGEKTVRAIQPQTLYEKRGDLATLPYVVAKDVDKGELRTFRLDRIKAARQA